MTPCKAASVTEWATVAGCATPLRTRSESDTTSARHHMRESPMSQSPECSGRSERRPHRQDADKENRPEVKTVRRCSGSGRVWEMMREVDAVKEQLAHEEKLRLQAEAQAGVGRNAKRTVGTVKEQLERVSKENECLQQQCSSLLTRLSKAEHDKDVALSEVSCQKLEHMKLKAAALVREAEVCSLVKELHGAHKEAASLKAERNGALDSVLFEMASLKVELDKALRACEIARQGAEKELEHVTMKNECLQERCSSLQAEQEMHAALSERACETVREEAQEQFERVSKEKEFLQEQCSSLQARLDKTESEKDAVMSDAASIVCEAVRKESQEQLEHVSKENRCLQEQCSALQVRLDTSRLQGGRIFSEMEGFKVERDEAVRGWAAARDETQLQLEHFSKENAFLQEQCSSLQARLDKAEHENVVLCEAASLKVEQGGAIRLCEATRKDVCEQLELASEDTGFSRQKCLSLPAFVNNTKHEQNKLSEAPLGNAHKQLERDMRLQAASLVREAEVRSLVQQLHDARKKAASLKVRRNEYAQSDAAKEVEVRRLTKELRQADGKVASMKVEMEEVFRALGTAHAEATKSRCNLEEQVSKHFAELYDKEMEARLLTKKLRKADQKNASLKKEGGDVFFERVCKQTESLAAKDAEIGFLTEELHKAREENASFREASRRNLEEERSSTLPQDVHVRNRQLLRTLEQYMQEFEMVEADNQGLRNSLRIYEGSPKRVANQLAGLTDHVTSDHKQKIDAAAMGKESLEAKDEVCKLQIATVCRLPKPKTKYADRQSPQEGELCNLLETLPSLSCLMQASESQKGGSSSIKDAVVTTLCRSTPQRFETVRTKLCRQADMVLEGVLQDFCHSQMLIRRATADCDDAQALDFGSLLSRLRSAVADRGKCDVVSEVSSS